MTSNDVEYRNVDASYVLRTMFYLLTPNETYYKTVEEIPPLVTQASNFFVTFIILEYILLLIKNGVKGCGMRINDGLSSITAGLISRIPDSFVRSIHLASYIWVYERFNIYEIPYNSIWAYIITFLLFDLGYYWFHRMAHEVNIFWAAHQVHHSSEEYNLTTALRQSVFQTYTSWMFYLPIALFIPPSVFQIHNIMNLLYQFWIHTEVIKSFGFLDGIVSFIFNTPSAHRVHHGRNRYCIDKNYGGVLIIWDRIFGTYEDEKESEKVAYGLVHNINTFDPIYIQLFHFKYLFEQVLKEKSWSNKFSILFKGPGWQPGLPRLGDYDQIPEIENPVQKHNPKIPLKLTLYVMAHFLFIFHQTGIVMMIHKKLTFITLFVFWSFTVFNMVVISKIFDKTKYSFHFETIRCLLWLAYDLYDHDFIYKTLLKSNDIAYLGYILFQSASILIILFTLMTKPTIIKKEEKQKVK